MSTNTHVLDLLPAYILNCLDDEDFTVVLNHLAECAICQAELQSYQPVVDQLALAVPQVAPAPGLKEKVMERARASIQVAPGPSKVSWWHALVNLKRPLGLIWSVASLLLILALAASNLLLWQQVNRLKATIPENTLPIITLTNTDIAPQATGLLVVSLDGRHGILVVDRLPALDPEHQYQLWLSYDDQWAMGPVFSVNPEGYGSVYVSSKYPLSNYSAFEISIEPAGGSPTPTGYRVLGSTLNY